jgi:SOS-response transcriptional repressor LexA
MMRTRPITAKQQLLLDMIYHTICREGRRPTTRELCAALGLSSTYGVACHLKTLDNKGYIKFMRSKRTTFSPYKLLMLPDGSKFHGFAPVRAGLQKPTPKGPD